MKRVNRIELDSKVNNLNELLKIRGIDKRYVIGGRYNGFYLDQIDLYHNGCVERTIACGTKSEVARIIDVICSVLLN